MPSRGHAVQFTLKYFKNGLGHLPCEKPQSELPTLKIMATRFCFIKETVIV